MKVAWLPHRWLVDLHVRVGANELLHGRSEADGLGRRLVRVRVRDRKKVRVDLR